MGLLSKLFGKKEPVGETPDAIVYMRREFLDHYFIELVNSGSAMFITFFPSTHKRLTDLIADENLKSRIVLFTGSAKSLEFESIKRFIEIPNRRIAIAERYPLRGKETALLELLRNNGITVPINAFCALNDMIILRFGGEKTMSLMQRMGVSESESIHHPMISSSIQRAQEKTLNKVTYEQQAKSPEEWYRLNLPQD